MHYSLAQRPEEMPGWNTASMQGDVYLSGCSLLPGARIEIKHIPSEAEAWQELLQGGDQAAAAHSGLSTACEVMWISWLIANTWIPWKPQESSREKVNIPVEPVLIRKPSYRGRGSVMGQWELRQQEGSLWQHWEAQLPLCLKSTWKVSPPTAAPWGPLQEGLVFSSVLLFFFPPNLFLNFSVILTNKFPLE